MKVQLTYTMVHSLVRNKTHSVDTARRALDNPLYDDEQSSLEPSNASPIIINIIMDDLELTWPCPPSEFRSEQVRMPLCNLIHISAWKLYNDHH